jgi:hypothetical protein
MIGEGNPDGVRKESDLGANTNLEGLACVIGLSLAYESHLSVENCVLVAYPATLRHRTIGTNPNISRSLCGGGSLHTLRNKQTLHTYLVLSTRQTPYVYNSNPQIGHEGTSNSTMGRTHQQL